MLIGPSIASLFAGGQRAIDRDVSFAAKGVVAVSGVGMMAATNIGLKATGMYNTANRLKRTSNLSQNAPLMGGKGLDLPGGGLGVSTNAVGHWKNRTKTVGKVVVGADLVGGTLFAASK